MEFDQLNIETEPQITNQENNYEGITLDNINEEDIEVSLLEETISNLLDEESVNWSMKTWSAVVADRLHVNKILRLKPLLKSLILKAAESLMPLTQTQTQTQPQSQDFDYSIPISDIPINTNSKIFEFDSDSLSDQIFQDDLSLDGSEIKSTNDSIFQSPNRAVNEEIKIAKDIENGNLISSTAEFRRLFSFVN
jgi:hypothetical protein